MPKDIFGNQTTTYHVKKSVEKDYSHPVLSSIEQDSEQFIDEAPEKRPTLFLLLILTGGFIILIFQLTKIQIVNAAYYRNLASGNSIRVIMRPADRGLILDSNNRSLVINIFKNALVVNLSELPRKEREKDDFLAKTKNLLNLSDGEIKTVRDIQGDGSSLLVIRNDLKQEEMLLLKEKLAGLKAFSVRQSPIRSYISEASLGHLLGYLGRVDQDEVKNEGFLPTENIGRSGLEKVYDKQLRGLMERITVEVDAYGNMVRIIPNSSNRKAVAGNNLKLHLNLDLQKEVTKYLQEAVDARNKQFGEDKKLGAAVIVQNPKNGAILSLVSIPSYDNNLFASGISGESYQKLKEDPSLPMLNRSIQAQLPSGSAIKPVIAASALDAGIISTNFKVDTPASIQVGSFNFPDWKDHGLTDIRRAIAESNNIFFYGLGGGWKDHITGLGIERLDNYFNRFGFGKKTNIDQTSENSGFVPSPDWKLKAKKEQWYIGDTYHFSIGQGDFLTTPIQLNQAISAIANGGTLYKPKIADVVVDNSNKEVEKIKPEINNSNFVSSASLEVVRQGMRQAVEYGSARQLNSLKVKVAAKTGTAQYGNQRRTHAWFSCFAPYENPEVVITAVIEGGGEGYTSALPVAEKILRYYFSDQAPAPAPNPEMLPESPEPPEIP